MKIECDKCRDMAVWLYAPSDGTGFYCDSHVPRGCSCNDVPLVLGARPGHFGADIMIRYRDPQGREFPCCEYNYEEDGFDEGIE